MKEFSFRKGEEAFFCHEDYGGIVDILDSTNFYCCGLPIVHVMHKEKTLYFHICQSRLVDVDDVKTGWGNA